MSGLRMNGGARPWTAAQKEMLLRLAAAEQQGWDEIAAECGHSEGSCRTTLNNLLRRIAEDHGVIFGKDDPRCSKRYWSAADAAELRRLRTVEKLPFPEIDRRLGRAEGASAQKFRALRLEPPADVVLTRAIHAPKYIPEHKTLTAAFFGDPQPGRSALDRRQKLQHP